MPMLFSKRYGHGDTAIQIDGLDQRTCTGLWNALYRELWSRHGQASGTYRDAGDAILLAYWDAIFASPLDAYSHSTHGQIQFMTRVKRCFTVPEAPWYQLLDIVELTILSAPGEIATNLTRAVNEVFARERAAFRMIGGYAVPVADGLEVDALETAIQSPALGEGAREHIQQAVKLFANRDNPDYRNAVKEAISAVEAACKQLVNKPSATLPDALSILEKRRPLHTAFKTALTKLYAYTSDADGIRHGTIGRSEIDFADAKFMLVTCAAFVNYLLIIYSEQRES